jgi:hypothetical protein
VGKMDRINKKQREILNCLDKVYPDGLAEEVLLTKLKDKPKDIDILADIKLLEENKLISARYESNNYPGDLTITPKGIEKLRENFKTRLIDASHNNPWIAIAVIISLFLGMVTVYYYSENIRLQNENLKIQNKIIQESGLKQIMPPTISLIQEFRNGSFGELEIIPTINFKKNNDRRFTISNYEINVTLNGKRGPLMGAGYDSRLRSEEIPTGKIVFPSFSPEIRYNEFNRVPNNLVIDYVLEIEDMDSQISYRGNMTTEVNSSISPPTSFPSGHEPLIFNWAKV